VKRLTLHQAHLRQYPQGCAESIWADESKVWWRTRNRPYMDEGAQIAGRWGIVVDRPASRGNLTLEWL